MAGKVKRASAPRARMAAMAVVVSSSSESMALCAAMIAVTPQMELPMASRLVSLGGRRKIFPSSVITLSDKTSSMATRTRLMPPMRRTSERTKRGGYEDDA